MEAVHRHLLRATRSSRDEGRRHCPGQGRLPGARRPDDAEDDALARVSAQALDAGNELGQCGTRLHEAVLAGTRTGTAIQPACRAPITKAASS